MARYALVDKTTNVVRAVIEWDGVEWDGNVGWILPDDVDVIYLDDGDPPTVPGGEGDVYDRVTGQLIRPEE